MELHVEAAKFDIGVKGSNKHCTMEFRREVPAGDTNVGMFSR